MSTSRIPRTKREAVAKIRATSNWTGSLSTGWKFFGKFTKNSQQAWLLLVPAFAEELAAWIADTKKGDDDKLFHVPQAAVQIMQKDLELAGIPYKTSQGMLTSTRCG